MFFIQFLHQPGTFQKRHIQTFGLCVHIFTKSTMYLQTLSPKLHGRIWRNAISGDTRLNYTWECELKMNTKLNSSSHVLRKQD